MRQQLLDPVLPRGRVRGRLVKGRGMPNLVAACSEDRRREITSIGRCSPFQNLDEDRDGAIAGGKPWV